MPAKNSEAIFWRPRFTKPLRAGKRANANFACSEGSFLSGVPRHVPGWPFLRGQPLLRRLVCQIFLPVRRCLVPGLRAAYLFLPDPCCRNLPAMRFVRAVPSCFGCLFACSALFARAFFSYLSPFPVWLLPLKLLFICRSGRDGDFLACPLPWLCSRPSGLVTCCFFADFCVHCLFACRALCFGCLFICLCCLRGFSLLFFTFSCLTFSSQTSFHLSLRPRRASTFFRKESRQRFAKGLRPFEPHSCALRPISPFPALLAGLRGPLGRKPPADKGNA